MSILIRGMEMPEDCGECLSFHCIFGRDICWAARGRRIELMPKKRPEWCPLIELPPHRRLIDADALSELYTMAQERMKKDKTDYANAFMNNGEPCTEWWCVEDMLENAKTIIPAEEGET